MIAYDARFNWLAGEEKTRSIDIVPNGSAPVIVRSAQWELRKNGEIIKSGPCKVIDNVRLEFTLLIEEANRAPYEIWVTYYTGTETRKTVAEVRCHD